MELQALASVRQTVRDRLPRVQQRLSTALPFLCMEDLVLVITLLGAEPNLRSILIGGTMSVISLSLLFWVQGYTTNWKEPAVIGPFRFVRHPLRLSLWLLAIGLSLGARSFPGLLLSLGILPCLYYFDLQREEALRRRQSLSALRYGKFVPALVPTIFPYRHESASLPFSWRRGLFGSDPGIRRRIGRFLLGWTLLILISREILTERSALIAACLWSAYLLVRAILQRKTRRLVFS